MAADVGCTQSLISRVVRGVQTPGPRLLEKIAGKPEINKIWLQTGQGEPLVPHDSLPISEEILSGPPHKHRYLLLPERYPVTREQYSETRYWLRIHSTQPVVKANPFKVRANDLLLLECDPTRIELDEFRGLAVARLGKADGKVPRLCHIVPEGPPKVFRANPFDPESETRRRRLVRQFTVLEYSDGTAEIEPSELQRKTPGGFGHRPMVAPARYPAVHVDDIVAVAIQLVRQSP